MNVEVENLIISFLQREKERKDAFYHITHLLTNWDREISDAKSTLQDILKRQYPVFIYLPVTVTKLMVSHAIIDSPYFPDGGNHFILLNTLEITGDSYFYPIKFDHLSGDSVFAKNKQGESINMSISKFLKILKELTHD